MAKTKFNFGAKPYVLTTENLRVTTPNFLTKQEVFVLFDTEDAGTEKKLKTREIVLDCVITIIRKLEVKQGEDYVEVAPEDYKALFTEVPFGDYKAVVALKNLLMSGKVLGQTEKKS